MTRKRVVALFTGLILAGAAAPTALADPTNAIDTNIRVDDRSPCDDRFVQRSVRLSGCGSRTQRGGER